MRGRLVDDFSTRATELTSNLSTHGTLSQRGRIHGEFDSPTRVRSNSAHIHEGGDSTDSGSVLSEAEAGILCHNRLQAELDVTNKRALLPEKVDPLALEMSAIMSGFQLLVCFAGLQISYLTWGYAQERIMTQKYGDDVFPSSLFLVFGNRVVAFTLVLAVVYSRKMKVCERGASVEGKQQMPNLLNFAPCSFSNVLSSWAQYECLKYISFPMQVVSKSCKVIPVMLVGKFIYNKSYSSTEYIEAIAIAYGVTLFQWSEMGDKTEGRDTSLFGVAIVIIYLLSDPFMSQWQSRIFQIYEIDHYQMMAGVNLFSLTFTSLSLIHSGGFISSFDFLNRHTDARKDVLILSLCSTVGQMFLYYTIKKFGPIILTMIMTSRQMFSMIISYIRFRHQVGIFAIVGSMIVFGSIGHSIDRRIREKGI